jgi:hypothetical protein
MHGLLRQHRVERALEQRDLEGVLLVGVASANSAPATALAPRGISASAASMRHGLCATPPTATRALPSRCTMAPTDTSAKAYEARSRTLR